MTHRTFERQVALLVSAWPQVTVTEATLAVYWDTVKHLDDTVFERAVQRVIETREWFPTVAALLAEADGVLTEAGRLPLDAEDAWAVVRGAIAGRERIGDRMIARVAREFGTMQDLRMQSFRDLSFTEAAFKRRYTGERQRMLRKHPEMMAVGLDDETAPALETGTDPGDALLAELAAQLEQDEG